MAPGRWCLTLNSGNWWKRDIENQRRRRLLCAHCGRSRPMRSLPKADAMPARRCLFVLRLSGPSSTSSRPNSSEYFPSLANPFNFADGHVRLVEMCHVKHSEQQGFGGPVCFRRGYLRPYPKRYSCSSSSRLVRHRCMRACDAKARGCGRARLSG